MDGWEGGRIRDSSELSYGDIAMLNEHSSDLVKYGLTCYCDMQQVAA